MQALRTIHKIENNILTISVPLDFKAAYVEVIILPYNKKEEIDDLSSNDNEELNAFQKLLLSAPVMSDEDYQFHQEKRNQFNQWK